MMFPCEIQERPVQHALVIRFHTPVQDLPKQLGRVYGLIVQYMKEIGAEGANAAFTIYHNMDMQNLDVEAGFPVAKAYPAKGEIVPIAIPAGTYAICHHQGPYDQMSPAYKQLTQFAKDKGYTLGQVAYEWYLTGPDVPPQDIRTDIALPVTRIVDQEPA